MKLKGLTKLVLAGTALAATAATLTTSTYAWYVVNTTVSAEGLSGATAGTSIGGSVLISYNSDEGFPVEYTTKLDFTTDNKVSDGELLPVTKATKPGYAKTADTELAAGKTYYSYNADSEAYTAVASPSAGSLGSYFEEIYKAGAWVDRDGKIVDVEAQGTKGQTGYTAPKVITYTFWLKASENTTASIKTKFTNTTTDAIKQTFYSETGLPTGKNKLDSFAVDAVYALRMEAKEEQYTVTTDTYSAALTEEQFNAKVAAGNLYTKSGSTYTAVATDATWDGTSTYVEKLTSAGKTIKTDSTSGEELRKSVIVGAVENHNATMGAGSEYSSPAIFDDYTNGDANKYFYSIMKYNGYGTDKTDGHSVNAPDSATTKWNSITLTKDVDTLITLTIWLEGTDAQCWDSCVGQDFKLDVTVEAN